MVQKSIRSSPRAPLGLLWELLGSLFGTVFSTLFLNVEMVAKIMPNGILRIEGLPLSAYPPSPSRTLPLSTSPKGDPVSTFSVWSTLSGTCSDKGDRKASKSIRVDGRQ